MVSPPFITSSTSYVTLCIVQYPPSINILYSVPYQDMKGKKEDDNGESKVIRESMHASQFANLIVHVEPEQRTNCPRPQSMPEKETGPDISARPAETESP